MFAKTGSRFTGCANFASQNLGFQLRWSATANPQQTGLKGAQTTSTADEADHLAEWNAAKPFDQLPGFKSTFGTIWAMLGLDYTKFLDFHRSCWKKFGPIYKLHVPGFPALVISTCPENAEKLFRADGKFPEKPVFESLKAYRDSRVEYYGGTGLLIANGEEWWHLRSKAQQPMMKPKNMANYIPALGTIAEDFIDRIRLIRKPDNEMNPDFLNEMYRWALESVALVGLNTRLGCLRPDLTPESEAQKMIDAANETFSSFNELTFGLPFWKLFPTPTLKKMYQAQDLFTETTVKYINQTLENIKNRPADLDTNVSILEELLIRGMTLKEATVLVIDLLLAGTDTTSHTTSFLLYFLAKNQEKQDKLRQEILSVVGPKGSPLTSGALNELHYLRACLKESLRMRPAVIGNGRIIDKNLVMSGYQIPKGVMAISGNQLMGEMEEYFPRPLEYIPERWIKGDPQESHHHPFTLLPFGFGTRMCMGRRLAELEMWQLTVKMIQNFRIEYHHQDIGCLNRVVNTPDQPLRFKLIDLPN